MRDLEAMDHGAFLSVLARADDAALKAEAEALLPALGPVEVIASRTGLVMMPMRETVQGTDFHLGEVLVAEAHLRLTDHAVEGYGMVTGRDLERAMAMAVLDGAYQAGITLERVVAFAAGQAATQADADEATLRAIAATRVEMETF